MCRIPVVIIAAVVIGGAGLTAMRGDRADLVHGCVGAGRKWFGSSCGHRDRLNAGVRASLDGGDFGGRYASGCHEVVRYRHAACTPAGLRQLPHAQEFRGDSGFTVPAISGDNVVSAYGSYTKIGTAQVKVSVCAKQTGTAFAVGSVAYAYNSSGASKNIGAVVLTGPGTSSCVSMTFLSYTAHLNIHPSSVAVTAPYRRPDRP